MQNLTKKSLKELVTIVADLATSKGGIRSVLVNEIKPYTKKSDEPLDKAYFMVEVVLEDGSFETINYHYDGDLVIELHSYNGLFNYERQAEAKV